MQIWQLLAYSKLLIPIVALTLPLISKKWIVDSGANQHTIASKSSLHDTVGVSKLDLLVSHPDGTSAKIEKKK